MSIFPVSLYLPFKVFFNHENKESQVLCFRQQKYTSCRQYQQTGKKIMLLKYYTYIWEQKKEHINILAAYVSQFCDFWLVTYTYLFTLGLFFVKS